MRLAAQQWPEVKASTTVVQGGDLQCSFDTKGYFLKTQETKRLLHKNSVPRSVIALSLRQ